jgi:hypothetical protein
VREDEQRADCAPRELFGRARVDQPTERPVSARAGDEEVDRRAEERELANGRAQRDVRLDIGVRLDSPTGPGDDQVDRLGKRGSTAGERVRVCLERLERRHSRIVIRGDGACERQRLFALG